jgi:KDO2-lipid IV(A) lauroyltransferase
VRGYLTYISYRLLAEVVGRSPPRVGYWLARSIASLLYRANGALSRIVTHNVRHVLGTGPDDAQVRAVARQVCTNILKGHYDLFRLARISGETIKKLTQIDGMEHLYEALARGKGAIIVTAHFGNVDLMAQVPALYNIPISGAVEHIQPERLFRYLVRIRQRHGVRLIPSDEPMIGLFRALKRGEIIALPCDRKFGDHSRPFQFFGSAAYLPDGPVRVALRTGAPLIPAFGLRNADDTFLVRVEPPLDLPQTGDLEADVTAGMEMVIAVMERYIGQNPEQWLVASPVWPMDQTGADTA